MTTTGGRSPAACDRTDRRGRSTIHDDGPHPDRWCPDRQSLPHLAGSGRRRGTGFAGEPSWLADDACDLVLDAASPMLAEAAARAVIGDAEIDVLVQPAHE